MASNLIVVLCGESEAQPVLNTGSLAAVKHEETHGTSPNNIHFH